jgi:hypothetical protein
VSAPWSIELYKDIIVVVNDEFSELLADEDLDRLGVVSRDVLRLEEGLEGSALEFLDELSQGIDSDALGLTAEVELLHVVSGVEETDGREVALLNTNELSEALLDALGGTRDNEEDLTLKLRGSISEDLGEGAVSVTVGSE